MCILMTGRLAIRKVASKRDHHHPSLVLRMRLRQQQQQRSAHSSSSSAFSSSLEKGSEEGRLSLTLRLAFSAGLAAPVIFAMKQRAVGGGGGGTGEREQSTERLQEVFDSCQQTKISSSSTSSSSSSSTSDVVKDGSSSSSSSPSSSSSHVVDGGSRQQCASRTSSSSFGQPRWPQMEVARTPTSLLAASQRPLTYRSVPSFARSTEFVSNNKTTTTATRTLSSSGGFGDRNNNNGKSAVDASKTSPSDEKFRVFHAEGGKTTDSSSSSPSPPSRPTTLTESSRRPSHHHHRTSFVSQPSPLTLSPPIPASEEESPSGMVPRPRIEDIGSRFRETRQRTMNIRSRRKESGGADDLSTPTPPEVAPSELRHHDVWSITKVTGSCNGSSVGSYSGSSFAPSSNGSSLTCSPATPKLSTASDAPSPAHLRKASEWSFRGHDFYCDDDLNGDDPNMQLQIVQEQVIVEEEEAAQRPNAASRVLRKYPTRPMLLDQESILSMDLGSSAGPTSLRSNVTEEEDDENNTDNGGIDEVDEDEDEEEEDDTTVGASGRVRVNSLEDLSQATLIMER